MSVVVQITYGRTINLGDYENARIELSAKVLDGQTAEEVLGQLRLKLDTLEEQERHQCEQRRAVTRQRFRK